MGAFVASFHVRSDSSDQVRQAVTEIGASQFRVANPRQGWVAIHEQRASTQDEIWIERFAQELSSRLQTACVAFMVHDSDIARYWLSDRGQLLDEYNSVPDYFEQVSAADRQRLRGRADVFLRYCQPHVTRQQVETTLRTEVTFAEDTITRLAEYLGIDPEQALEDFNHPSSGGGGGWGSEDGDDDDGDDGGFLHGSAPGRAGLSGLQEKMQQRFVGLFAPANDPGTSPQSNALVQAAASGNIGEIERLVHAGADLNAPGMLPIESFGESNLLPAMGLAPKVALTPLMAAASKGEAKAVQRLLELGARSENHPLYGSVLHAAAQKGSVETVRILLDAGIPADVKTRQGYTPRQLIQAVRNQIEMSRQLVKSMPQLQQVYGQFSAKLDAMNLPEAGWHACEELLRQAGG
jgi:hypothetical protein